MGRKKEKIFKKVPSIDVQMFLQEQIKNYIINKKFSPGDKLPSEVQLSKEFGVSRSTIREALRALEGVGILTSQHGSGWYVNSFNFDALAGNLAYSLQFDTNSIFDLLQIREVLELSFLEEALESLREKDLDELGNIINIMKSKLEQGKPFIKEDMMFHRILFRRIKNQIVIKILDIFWKLFEHLDEPLLYSANQDAVINYHMSMLNHIKNKDYEKTKSILKEHFIDVYERLLKYKNDTERRCIC